MSTSDDLKTYFDREWQRFQTDVKDFAKAYPEQAGHLHLESPFGRDPNVDHLLQGCTYLSAQIHKRIDEETNTLPSQLAMQLWPQMAENVPSMSVASFQLKSLMAQSQVVPAQTALFSQPVGDDKTICHFETLADLPIYPFEIKRIQLNHETSSLTLVFESPFDRPISLNSIQSLPLFLADEYAQASELYYYLRHCKKARIKVGETVRDDVLSLRFPIDSPDYSLQHSFKTGLLAHQILFDYFSFHQAFLFCSIHGFEKLGGLEAKQFEVTFLFETSLSEDFRIHATSLQMNTCVIVNRFSMECEPIKYDHAHYRYPVYADRRDGTSLHLLRVDAVQGIEAVSGRITRYLPLHQCEDPASPSYTLSREKRDDESEMMYISCFGETKKTEVLSVTATVCHGFHPKRFVAKNGLSLGRSHLSNICAGTNILVPTKMLKPPTHLMSQSFIRYFTLSLNSLLQVEVLKRLLHTLNWTTDPQHKRRIDGLLSVSVATSSQVSKGAFYHVCDIHIHVHHSYYVSAADIYFFGDMLNAFFAAQASMSQMVSMQIKTYPNEEVFEWKPMFGLKNVV